MPQKPEAKLLYSFAVSIAEYDRYSTIIMLVQLPEFNQKYY
jgi:hypothetical protein